MLYAVDHTAPEHLAGLATLNTLLDREIERTHLFCQHFPLLHFHEAAIAGIAFMVSVCCL